MLENKFKTTSFAFLLLPDGNIKCPNCGTVINGDMVRMRQIPVDYSPLINGVFSHSDKQAYTYCFNCNTRNILNEI